MYKKSFKILVLSVTLSMLLSSCGSSDDNADNPDPVNPTNGLTTAVFNPGISYENMTDQDGNIYKTVTIGTQTWMAENLRTTKYNDGTDINEVTNDLAWYSTTSAAYCNYNNTSSFDLIATYGRLYNWYAVNTGKLAPEGWHVPNDAEWLTLINYLNANPYAAKKLKEWGNMHWNVSDLGTNESGFTALPGGYRYLEGDFLARGSAGFWWSTTEVSDTNIKFYSISGLENVSYVHEDTYPKNAGFSIRLVKNSN